MTYAQASIRTEIFRPRQRFLAIWRSNLIQNLCAVVLVVQAFQQPLQKAAARLVALWPSFQEGGR